MVDSNRASRGNPEQRREQKQEGRFGIYMGEVISTKDVSRTGRIRVYVAALGKDKSTPGGNFDCIWVSPFAGSTDYSKIQGGDTTLYENTHQSYGLWMVPPDVGNIVLVAFGDGSSKFPLCMGCLFPDHYNYMVPGMPSGLSFQGGTSPLPVAEKNKFDANTEHGPRTPRPAHHDFAEALTKQGLINDTLRGPTSSGAKRESPSEVYGFLSPGPKDPKTGRRSAGHQLIFDDNMDNRQIRLRSAGGTQLLLDDTTGIVYVINRNGTAWFEMTPTGGFNFFGEDDINFRTKKNFNLRADNDVNIESGGDLKFRAAGDTARGQHIGAVPLGMPPLGYGGNIRFQAAADVSQLAGLNTLITSFAGDIDLNSAGHIAGTAAGPEGIRLNTPTGPIKLHSTGASSILAASVQITSALPITMQSSTIFLNSGGAVAPAIANPSATAPSLATNNFQDQPSTQPKYDRTAKHVLPEGGIRPVRGKNITSIVTNMTTAEPYIGHGQYDPTTEIPGSQAPDPSFKSINNSIDSNIPADVDTPAGFSVGLPTEKLSQPINKLTSNFSSAKQKALASIPSLPSVAGGLGAVIPPIRMPTTNAALQKVIGAAKVLTENEYRISQFAISRDGLPLDINSSEAKAMRDKITAATKGIYNDIKTLV